MEICIIGGFPRAGTRQFTDYLNKINSFQIKGEFYPRIVRSLLQTFSLADDLNKNRWTNENYRKCRMRSALNAYAAFSKGSNSPYDFKNINVAGFKSPRAEIDFDTLKSLIGFDKVVFFYCIRNIRDNFLSENSTFGISIEDYVLKTVGSMQAGLKLTEDTSVNFKILNLDEYISSKNKALWVLEKILSNFDSISVSLDEVEKLLMIRRI